MGKIMFAIAFLALSGCAAATLTPEGKRVKIVEPVLVDLKLCKSMGSGVYQTVRKDQGAYKWVVLIDLKNQIAAKQANVGATTYPLREVAGDYGYVPIDTPIPYEAFECSNAAWEKLRPIEAGSHSF